MKRILKSMLGVTLLEIMLVLAIASMVIVMSIRYYNSANASQSANALLEQIQSITAAADSLAQGAGGYSSAGLANSTLAPLLPTNGLVTPWNQTITVTAASATTYTVAIPGTPVTVCAIITTKLKTNSRYTIPAASTCTGTTPIAYSYTYTAS